MLGVDVDKSLNWARLHYIRTLAILSNHLLIFGLITFGCGAFAGSFLDCNVYNYKGPSGALGRKIMLETGSVRWEQQWTKYSVCDDTCPLAGNGVCNDGRSGQGEVLCDLGRDCKDCGAWVYTLEKGNDPADIPRPIELLRNANVLVNVARTASQPSFVMPYTDANQDVDVSRQMLHQRLVEQGLTQAWHSALNGKCQAGRGKRQLVLDVGGNFGYYTFYAASHGCRVVVWEPVPTFRAFLQYGIWLNGLTKVVRLRDRVVSDVAGKQYNLTVPAVGIWGTASIGGRNIDRNIGESDRSTVTAISERVDDLIAEDVLLMKIDVEGFEPQAYASAAKLFTRPRVQNLFMEYSPGVTESNALWNEIHIWPLMLKSMVAKGYTILHVNDHDARGHSLLRSGRKWEGPLQSLPEVTSANIMYDLMDVEKYQERKAEECWPEELRSKYPHYRGCLSIPEDLNPKSFRSTFGHNTNIWASLDRKSLQIEGAAGTHWLNQTEREWFAHGKYGLGGRSCEGMASNRSIRHRCRCRSGEGFRECQEEAAHVESLIEQGLMKGHTPLVPLKNAGW